LEPKEGKTLARRQAQNAKLALSFTAYSVSYFECLKVQPALTTYSQVEIIMKLFHSRSRQLPFLLGLLIFANTACFQDSNYLKENYVKKEYRVPMRDGVTLFTSVLTPKDLSQKYPILMTRTPYTVDAYGEDNFPLRRFHEWKHLAEEKFIFVLQDVRGRFMSEGEFVNMRPYIPNKRNSTDIDETTDTYDTIDWLIKNIPNNNGNVGIFGISYPGFYSAMGAIDAHPALKAVSPQAPIANWFGGDDVHHNGAFALSPLFGFWPAMGAARPELTTQWPAGFEFPTPDGYQFFLDLGPMPNANKKYLKHEIAFWDDLMKHGTYDEFWQSRSSLPHFKDIKPAVMTVGGWFDAENCYGALQTYQSIEKNNPGAYNILVEGPWFHGGWVRSDGSYLGNIQFGSKTGEYYKKNIELPFFKYFLKNEGELDLPEAYVFVTGSNEWKKYDVWPPENTKEAQLFFQENGRMDFERPANEAKNPFDEYISDPAKPVPFTAQIINTMPREYMVEDQRFVAGRTDVLVYKTDPLQGDITVVGPITAELFVSTSGTDSDWIVKLIDVYPDDAPDNDPNPCDVRMAGFQMLLRGDIMRGKFRNSMEEPEPFVPNQVTRVKFKLNDVYHTFLKGHRIMVQIQSSWFPLFDRNPQKFVDIYSASEKDFQKAIQRVYHSGEFASNLKMNLTD
jgi:putative CocE/NonD family hydrolase